MNKVHLTSLKKIYSTSSRLPISYKDHDVYIYNGRTLINRKVNKYNIGMRAGTLVWCKKPSLLKKSQKKK